MKPKYRYCPVCGCSTSVTVIRHLTYAMFDDSTICGDYDLVSCDACNFVYCDTSTTDSDFIEYYQRNLHYLSGGCGMGSRSETERYHRVLLVLKRHGVGRAMKIMDIGSANGGMLFHLKNHGYTNLVAIDPLLDCVKSIMDNGVDAQQGSADRLPAPDGSVDVVILSHVLEHVADIGAVISEVFRVLSKNGIVYAEVPTIEYGISFAKAPAWDFIYDHINYFSHQNLPIPFARNHLYCLESGVGQIYNGNGTINCLYGVFGKSLGISPRKVMVDSFSAFDSRGHGMESLALSGIPCYVWGISEYMQMVIASTALGKCNIVSFIDKSSYKQTKTIGGIAIKSPDILQSVISRDVAVVFAVEPYADEMNQYLDKIGFSGMRIEI